MNKRIYYQALKTMNKMVPFKECDYRNGVIASAFAKGKQDRLNDNWIKNALLQDYEDGFISYEQAVALNPIYIKAVNTLRGMF